MDITVYLPDELGREAKAAELNLSRLLRDAVTDELHRRKTVATTLENPTVYEIDLEDENGNYYTGRITGTRLGLFGPGQGEMEIFLTDDERVLLYDRDARSYWQLEDPEEELRDVRWLTPGEYTEVLSALGIKPTIDI